MQSISSKETLTAMLRQSRVVDAIAEEMWESVRRLADDFSLEMEEQMRVAEEKQQRIDQRAEMERARAARRAEARAEEAFGVRGGEDEEEDEDEEDDDEEEDDDADEQDDGHAALACAAGGGGGSCWLASNGHHSSNPRVSRGSPVVCIPPSNDTVMLRRSLARDVFRSSKLRCCLRCASRRRYSKAAAVGTACTSRSSSAHARSLSHASLSSGKWCIISLIRSWLTMNSCRKVSASIRSSPRPHGSRTFWEGAKRGRGGERKAGNGRVWCQVGSQVVK